MDNLINNNDKKALVWGIGAFWLFIMAMIILSAVGLGMYGVFGTAEEEIRHHIFKKSTAHIEGSIRTIEKYQIEYVQAKSEEEKTAIAGFVIREARRIEPDDLPADLTTFVVTLKNKQLH